VIVVSSLRNGLYYRKSVIVVSSLRNGLYYIKSVIVVSSLRNGLYYRLFCLFYQGLGFTVGFTGQQEILTPSRKLILYLVYPEICVFPSLNLYFYTQL
jgi:hypothetical protein